MKTLTPAARRRAATRRLPRPSIPEPPRIASLYHLAPQFRVAVERILADMKAAGWKCRVFESVRTNERQQYLYGFGRDYDDGRGPVTKARTALGGWHFYGLAVDIVEDDATPWVAPQAFWQALGRAAERHGCKWGGRWETVDLPHVQFGKCRVSPSEKSRLLYAKGGHVAVWKAVGAL